MDAGPGEATRLFERMRAGDAQAGEAVFALLYEDLHRIADRLFRSQRRNHTLEPTALVHEAYLKMLGSAAAATWQDSAHALAVGARAMRQVLANHARDRAAQKRGAGRARERITVSVLPGQEGASQVDAAAFHEALDRLRALDERQAKIAEMRLLGGLSTAQIATLLGIAPRTVELDWSMAKRQLAQWLAVRTDAGSA